MVICYGSPKKLRGYSTLLINIPPFLDPFCSWGSLDISGWKRLWIMPLGTLLVICLAAKERVIPRMACLQCTLWLPECSCFCGHGRRTSRSWSDEGKQDNGAISNSPGDAPCDLPQLQSKFQNQGPLDLSCPNSPPCLLPRPCCGPDPVITSCVEEHPHTHTDFGLFGLSSTPSQSFWTPFQSLSSFAGWLHLGLDPTLFFVVHWAQPMHLRPKVLNHGFFSCKGKLLRYFLFHLPGNPLALGNGHC